MIKLIRENQYKYAKRNANGQIMLEIIDIIIDSLKKEMDFTDSDILYNTGENITDNPIRDTKSYSLDIVTRKPSWFDTYDKMAVKAYEKEMTRSVWRRINHLFKIEKFHITIADDGDKLIFKYRMLYSFTFNKGNCKD